MRRPMYETGPRPRARRRSRFWLVGLPMFAVFAAFGSIVWVAYVDSAPGSAVGEPPLIKADASPIKLSPDDPGGRVVADQGEVRQLLSDENMPQRERLLPPPEQPMAPPDGTGTAALGETSGEPATGTADQAPKIEQQTLEPSGGDAETTSTPAGERESVVATTTPEASTPAPQALPEPSAAPAASESSMTTGSPPNDDGVGDAPEPSPATEDAEAALESLLAEVTSDRDTGPAAASPGEAGPETARPAGSDVAPAVGGESSSQRQSASFGASAAADGAARRDVASTSADAGAGTSQGGPQAEAPGTVSASRVPVEPMRSQTEVASSGPTYRIQLAAVRDEADARRAWDLFQLDLGDVLASLDPVIERAETANGTFYRVQVGEFASLGNAEALCDRLKQRNASCFVIRR